VIAERQVALEDAAARHAHRFLFCDTSPLTTLLYSEAMFGAASPVVEASAARWYDLAVLCAPDFPFVQDGTRRDASFRSWQHHWYVERLQERELPWILVSGDVDDRVAQVCARLEAGSPGVLPLQSVRA
jgi:nicotinamide riboside kinase